MSALFSTCGHYRYRLTRELAGTGGALLIIGLNPSTADATHNDPTIRRCIGFAERWGHSALIVANLFAFRATHPKDLKKAADPVGPECDRFLLESAMKASRVLVAWGYHGAFLSRHSEVTELLKNHPLECLGKTQSGLPRHPLYIRADTLPQSY